MSSHATLPSPAPARRSSPTDTLLVVSILGSPTLVLVNQQVNYLLVYWACRTGHVFVLHVVTLVCLAIVTALGMATARHGRADPTLRDRGFGSAVGHRRRFMAAVGTAVCLLCALGIIAFAVPTFFIEPCQR